MESVLQFLKENENLMESNSSDDFDFFDSDEFYNLDNDTKREVFYLKAFYMSTQEYSSLKDCVLDFKHITQYIKENDYLNNTHECYETMICNYLNSIDDLLNPCIKKDKEDFINNFHIFNDKFIFK